MRVAEVMASLRWRIAWAFLAVLTLTAASAWAESPEISAHDSVERQQTDSTIARVDKAQEKVSQVVQDAAHWLDTFFDDERSASEDNKTRVKVKTSVFKQSSEDAGFSIDFDLRLSLPTMENRLLLIISGNPDTDEALDDSPLDEARRRFEERNQNNLNAALRFFPKLDALSNLSFDAGLAFRDIVPAAYLGGRYRRLFDLFPWQSRFTQTVRWYTDRGVEAKARIDMERQIKGLFFRASSELAWYQDNDDGLLPDLRFFLYQPWGDKRVIEYEWNNYFKTRPDFKLDTVVLRARLRQRLGRKWLFGEVAPQIAFREGEDWEADPGILLRLEVNFGFVED